eukprot:10026498-Alexandrium_andersonii.AAC.1
MSASLVGSEMCIRDSARSTVMASCGMVALASGLAPAARATVSGTAWNARAAWEWGCRLARRSSTAPSP